MEPNKPRQRWLDAFTALLGKWAGRLADILRDAHAAGAAAALPLLDKVRDQFHANARSGVGHWLPRIGSRNVSLWRWLSTRGLDLLRAYPITATLAVVALIILGYIAYCVATVPSDGGLVIEPTPSALVVEADGGQVFATRGVFKGDKLSAQEVPLNLSQAIIAIEDRHFYEHTGFYLPSLIRAAYRNFLAGGAREGGSTITQQLARMTYLSQERTIKRKI